MANTLKEIETPREETPDVVTLKAKLGAVLNL
jgi:hypothetical protein